MNDCISEGDLESWWGSVLSDYKDLTPIKVRDLEINEDKGV